MALLGETESEIAAVLTRDGSRDPERAAMTAHIVSAIMFVAMATTINVEKTLVEVVAEIESHIGVLLA
ncbi:hypothetical protein CH300_04350 [Rhodococcus sp. 15-1154-1]|nr:hypothetical protein CH300_04350 [Rhodococcus sp. 15-1154-1]